MMGKALDMLAWLSEKRAEFAARDVAEAFGMGVRQAQRYIAVAEARGLVERGSRGRWRSKVGAEYPRGGPSSSPEDYR
jgi:DNA-binding IclR family transcriptional regulator